MAVCASPSALASPGTLLLQLFAYQVEQRNRDMGKLLSSIVSPEYPSLIILSALEAAFHCQPGQACQQKIYSQIRFNMILAKQHGIEARLKVKYLWYRTKL